MKYSKNILFLILTAFVCTTVSAEIYKWVDEKGKVYFGDHPPGRNSATEFIIDTENHAGITHSSGNNKERARMAKELETDRKQREEKRKKAQVNSKNKKRKCALARDRLRRLQRAGSVYKLDKEGNRKYYSKQQRDKKEKQVKKSIARYCR